MHNDDSILVKKIKDAFKGLEEEIYSDEYPKEAMPKGTYVRAKRLDRLGIITDAFYGDKDADKNKIIVYTVLVLPKKEYYIPDFDDNRRKNYYITNEYEYEVIGYLMMNPVDMSEISIAVEERYIP
jgi:hypothetical protein